MFEMRVSHEATSYEGAQAIVPSNSETKGRSFSFMCTKVFDSIKSRFQSPPAPLSTKSKDDLTNICVHLDEDINTGKSLEETVDTVQGRCGSKLVKVVLFALLANYAGFRFFQSQTGSQPQLDPSIGTDLDLTATMLTQLSNRALLSSPTLPTSNYSLSATEEVPFSQSFNTWDIFPFANQGRLIVSTTSPLPAGVTLVQTPIRKVSSISNSQGGLFAATNRALYAAQGGGTVQIINTQTISNPYVTNVFNTGVVSDMVIVGDNLYCVGNDMIIKIFNISQPFNPIAQGEISVSGIGVNRIVSNEIDKQLGCITESEFFCIDASDSINPVITGNITNLPGIVRAITSSPGYYYIGTSLGIVIVNTTNASSPNICRFLPTQSIVDLKYFNNFCYATTNFGIFLVVDVQNPTNPIVVNNITYPEFIIGLSPPTEGLMYYISTLGMGILDLSNKTNPVIAVSSIFPDALLTTAFQDEYVIFYGRSSDINFATRRDTFSFTGIPAGESKGNYRALLTATTLGGQVIDEKQTFELDILPAVTPSKPIQNFIAAVGQVFNKIINPNSFNQINGKPLIYSLECEPESTLSSSIYLNSVSAQFSGTPPESAVGSTACTIMAKDSAGASGKSLPFNISVFYGPTVNSVPNQIAIIGQPFALELAVSTKDSFDTSYTIKVSNLPSGFVLQNNTIVGTPITSDLGTYPIDVTATDQYGLFNTKAFLLNVVIPGVPVFLNPLSSQTVFVGYEFSFAIPLNAAVNPSNPNTAITYSASLPDGSSLPSWIDFDGIKFTCTPPRTEILFTDVIHAIVLTATQKLSNGETSASSTAFTITVSGTSVAKQIVTIGGPLVSILGILLTARFCLYNHLVAKPKFISCVNRANRIFCCCFDPEAMAFYQSNEVFIERQSLEYKFKTKPLKIAKIETFYNGEPFPGRLPHWLKYDANRLIGKISTDFIPELEGIQSIKIIATDKKGYRLEEVTFTKEETTDDHNFSRPCQTDRKKIKTIRFFSAGTEVSQPSWIEYKKSLNRIIAKDAPSLIEIEPLTMLIFGQDGQRLETIYINHAPNKNLLTTDELNFEEDVPLLHEDTDESKSSSSNELNKSSFVELVEFKKEGKKDEGNNENAYEEL